MNLDRHSRIRKLIRQLNIKRRRQSRQIDILCNDIINAHRNFSQQLSVSNFTVNFYENLLAQTDLKSVLNCVSRQIRAEIAGSSVAIYLCQSSGFEHHFIEDSADEICDAASLEEIFSPEISSVISASSTVMDLQDMLKHGLQCNTMVVSQLSIAAVPLKRFGPAMGYILIYRKAAEPIPAGRVNRVSAIVPGICRAIAACQVTAG